MNAPEPTNQVAVTRLTVHEIRALLPEGFPGYTVEETMRLEDQALDKLRAALTEPQEESSGVGEGADRKALEQINAIRESIVAHQNINWSAHIYPLVAILNAAGCETPEFEEMKERYVSDRHGDTGYERLGAALEERGMDREINPLLRGRCRCFHGRSIHNNVVGDSHCRVNGCTCNRFEALP